MTIAIGAHCNRGIVLCADTKIVWEGNGNNTTYGQKVFARRNDTAHRSYAVAAASRDGNAANGLAQDILGALYCCSEDYPDVEWKIKDIMAPWFANYGQISPPTTELLVAASWENHYALYFCQPPQTVTSISIAEPPKAIGYGARPIEPLLAPNRYEILTDPRCVLMRLGYLMYRAKKDEAAMCGGATDCFVIHGSGGLIRITQGEMEKAESLGIMMDSLFDNAFTNLSIGGSEELQKFQSAEVADKYLKVAQQAQKVQFYSLRNYGIT